jgi:hypothetical protein
MIKTLLPAVALLVGSTAIAQTHFSDDFNDLNLTGWTNVDNDSDASTSNPDYNLWYTADFSSYFADNGAGTAVSRSWAANVVYHPDNFLISPAIDLTAASGTGLNLLFKTGSIEASPYFDEHYAVYVTTSSNPATIVTSTPVFEETLPGNQMYSHTIDMSAYAGQTVYITFRHFNTVDENTLLLDDVVVKNLQPNDASLQSVSLARYSAVSTNNTLGVLVKNEGSNAITSLQINWNDGTDHIQTVSANIAPGATATVNHPTAVNYATAVEEALTVTILQVNATSDSDPSNNSDNALINTVSQMADKNVVIEEGTGTWCGWCPRGAVAMEYMTTNYPDDFIGIAVHNGDPMTVTEYDAGANLSGYPGCNVDRAMLDQGVSQAAFVNYYNARVGLAVPAAITATSSGAGSSATIDVTATFYTPFAAANYRLGVIIVEDDVTGTSSGYNQNNYYAGGANGAMGGYENLPASVPAAQMVYDHVGRALLGGYSGQASTVPTTLTDGQAVNYTFNYTVPATSNRANMHAVAVLIDQTNGEIVNAEEVSIATVGLGETETIDMQVFPNPASDVVNVKFEGQGGVYTVTVTDLAGREVSASVIENASGAQTVALPIAGLAGGNYLVTIAKEGASYTQNLVIK